MSNYEELARREAEGRPIRVVVVGAGGAMGRGVALQIGKTPGIRMVAAVDVDLAGAQRAAELHGRGWVLAATAHDVAQALRAGRTVITADAFAVMAHGREAVDVMVESTDTVAFAARIVIRALGLGVDVVLMNAELDCLLGPLLNKLAGEAGVVVTSDAGDQHGVLLRMIDEIRLWGLEIVMAGNIKGFLDRYATPKTIVDEARKRNLNPVMCAAYTDGTKLNIEMALVANATGLVPTRCGMLGPRARHVSEVFEKFDFAHLRNPGVVDYILGAEPGGGVFVVAHCDDPVQQGYLRYYKMGDGPFYLAYRPYHLCHMETPLALAEVALRRSPILVSLARPVADVAAFAKTDLAPGATIEVGVGGAQVYGMIDRAETLRQRGAVPICLLDREDGPAALILRQVQKDQLVTWDDVELSPTPLLEAYRRQERLLGMTSVS
jgi:predicted homoserine dehydrogenase-like protein